MKMFALALALMLPCLAAGPDSKSVGNPAAPLRMDLYSDFTCPHCKMLHEQILKDVNRAELVRLMVGRDIQAIFPKREVPIGAVALEVRGLGCRAAGIHDVTFQVRRGEILGIAGLVGSGRTQLAETLFGLTPCDGGAIQLQDDAVRIESPAEAIRLKMAYLPEDRRQHGVVMEMSVAANISLANLDAVSRHGLIDDRAERNLARGYVERLRIKTPSIYSETGSLSGG